MILLELFWSFFQIGLLSIGGGYAAVPLIQKQVVEQHNWLTMTQFADIMTIAEMTPGPISINSATFVGIQVAGIPGAIIATLGCVIPSSLIVLFLAYIYYHYRGLELVQGVLTGLRPVVVAMIASAGFALLLTALFGQRTFPQTMITPDWIACGLFAAVLFVLRKQKLSPVYCMIGAGMLGCILYSFL